MDEELVFGIVTMYQGASGKDGYYNNQEIGLARAMVKRGYKCVVFYPDSNRKEVSEKNIEHKIVIVKCPARHIGVNSVYDWSILSRYEVKTALVAGDNQIFAPSILRYCEKNHIRTVCYVGTILSDSSNRIKKYNEIIGVWQHLGI